MTNRLPAQELLQVIHGSHAERRAETQPRRESSGDLDVSLGRPVPSLFGDLRRPMRERPRASLTARSV